MEIQTIGNKVVNDDGQVAVKYFQPMSQTLKIGSKVYIFVVRKSLSIAWIEPEDVDAVLNVVKICCGNTPHKVFRLEHETHVKRWLNWIE